jgi:hypothetical protein
VEPAISRQPETLVFRGDFGTQFALERPRWRSQTQTKRLKMDILIIIAILLIIFGGIGTAVGFLADLIWILILIGVVLLIFRLISGRRV